VTPTRTPPTKVIEPTTVVGYLRGRGLLSERDRCTVGELTGGVSSVVIGVEAPGRRLVVKQSLPRLRVAADWQAKPERILVEAAGLELASALTPGRVPRVLDVDGKACAIVIELAPNSWTTWKQELFEGSATRALAHDLGETLGTWHRATAADAALRAPFEDRETFIQLRVEPYYLTVADRHRALGGRIEAIVARMGERRLCFVHGDFSPKNVLVGSGDFWVLDFEVAHVGDPVFDVAFMLHHLTLKAIHTGAVDRIASLALAFGRAYRAAGGGSAFDDADYLSAHIGCLLLGRVDGKSPADYLTLDGRHATRTEGISLVSGERGTYDSLWRRR
jgi:aminoglycoside phosphotransferase (APT) family kinase protein